MEVWESGARRSRRVSRVEWRMLRMVADFLGGEFAGSCCGRMMWSVGGGNACYLGVFRQVWRFKFDQGRRQMVQMI